VVLVATSSEDSLPRRRILVHLRASDDVESAVPWSERRSSYFSTIIETVETVEVVDVVEDTMLSLSSSCLLYGTLSTVTMPEASFSGMCQGRKKLVFSPDIFRLVGGKF
jgi:UDP-glucose 4-epimerase